MPTRNPKDAIEEYLTDHAGRLLRALKEQRGRWDHAASVATESGLETINRVHFRVQSNRLNSLIAVYDMYRKAKKGDSADVEAQEEHPTPLLSTEEVTAYTAQIAWFLGVPEELLPHTATGPAECGRPLIKLDDTCGD
jgi:hypothetical protein